MSTSQDKTCFKCGIRQSLDGFYKHPRMKDGYLNKCKNCTKTDSLLNRRKNEDYYNKYDRDRAKLFHRKQSMKIIHEKWKVKFPEKRKAHIIFNNAIRDNKIKKLPCWECGNVEVEGHHPDYDQPLQVVWLCTKHHKEIHRKF